MIDETESLWRTAKESSCTVQRHRWPVREQPQTSLKKMRPPFSCCFPGVGPGGVWLLFTVLTEHRLYRTCGQYYINWMQCKSAWGYKCRKSILLRVTNIRSQTRTACEHILSESRLCSNTHTDTHTSVWIKMTIVRELVLFVWLQTNWIKQEQGLLQLNTSRSWRDRDGSAFQNKQCGLQANISRVPSGQT